MLSPVSTVIVCVSVLLFYIIYYKLKYAVTGFISRSNKHKYGCNI